MCSSDLETKLIFSVGRTKAIAREPKTIVTRIKALESKIALGKFFCGFFMSFTCTPASSIPKKEAMMAIKETQQVVSEKQGVKLFAVKEICKG